MSGKVKPHATAALFVFSLVMTAPVSPGTGGAALAKDISVGVDQATMVRLPQPGVEVVIGNPSIADITVQNAQLLAITGKSFGITNLIVLDTKGREIMNEKIRVHTDHKRQVSLYRGSARQSYDCTGRCQSALVPGDHIEYFEGIAKSVTQKFGVAQSAVDGEVGQQ